MLRKWMLSTVAGITLMTPLAVAPAAQAKAPEALKEAHHDRDRDRDRGHDHDRWRERDHWRRHYDLMYRQCCDAPWSYYGCYDSYEDACHAEFYLRGRGYEVSLR